MLSAVIPKIAVSCSQSILFSCTNEFFAPEKRRTILFSCLVWARIWVLTAPFINTSSATHQILPLSVYGMLSIIGGITLILLSSRTLESKSLNMVVHLDYLFRMDGKL